MSGDVMYERVIIMGNEPGDLPREGHDAAIRLLDMALAEAGYPRDWWWDGEKYVHSQAPIPKPILMRARQMVCDQLGLPYELREVHSPHEVSTP